MKQHRILIFTLLATLATAPLCFAAPSISGDYLEARTSDVYTGSCFANSEMNLAGKEAVFAWRVREGAWRGVPVEGLAVVAVVRAAATLGDPMANPLPARAVLLVDERADPAQRDALVGFAREMGGDLLADVVSVESAPIRLSVDGAAGSHSHAGASGFSGGASLEAGDVVELKTARGL